MVCWLAAWLQGRHRAHCLQELRARQAHEEEEQAGQQHEGRVVLAARLGLGFRV